MTAFSAYSEDKILDHSLGTQSWTSPANIYLALYTTSPSAPDGTGGVEVADAGAYARQAIAFNVASAGATDNTAEIVFPTATANWGVITGFGIHDSATHGGGNLIYFGNWATSKDISTNDIFRLPAGNLTISLD
jgi:hypothetical protein